jgi:hypothetical protein
MSENYLTPLNSTGSTVRLDGDMFEDRLKSLNATGSTVHRDAWFAPVIQWTT